MLVPAGSCDGDHPPVQLTGGTGEVGDITGGGADPTFDGYVAISTEATAPVPTLDVDGDGTPEALVLISCSYGGNGGRAGTSTVIAVAEDADGALVLVGEPFTSPGGAGAAITGVRAEGDAMVIDSAAYAPGDANCCPSLTSTTRWQQDASGAWQEAADGEAPDDEGGAGLGELELRPDGIGVASFGADLQEVVAAVNAALGSEPEEFDNRDGSLDPDAGALLAYTWSIGTARFRVIGGFPSFAFSSYDLSDLGDTGAPAGPDGPTPETPEGVTTGTSVDDLFAAYSGLQALECLEEFSDGELAPATGPGDGTFLTSVDGYRFVVSGGLVTSVDESQGPLDLFCYG